jgi:hypothetical protein
MKNTTMFQIILIFICLLGYSVSSAQVTDYIVLTQGDTLYGKVSHFNYGVNQRVQLVDNTKKKTLYPMMQVKSFQIKEESFHLVKMHDKYAFMKLITPGYLSYYLFQIENQVTWDGRYLYLRDGRGLEVPNLGFKKRVGDFLSDCTEVSDKVTDGTLGRSELEEIITAYNACIGKRTDAKTIPAPQKPDVPVEKINAWNELESAVKEATELSDKETILEMIADIKSKTARGERIPNFLVDGLTKSLEGHNELTHLLSKALNGSTKKDN